MKTSFSPSITCSSNNGIAATLPSDQRSTAWSILFNIQDHVVKIDRNCGPTQLQIWPNPGYSKEEALAIMIVAVYVSSQSLESLLSVPEIAKHIVKIRKNLLNLETLNVVDESLVEYYLGNYIIDHASKKIDSRLANVHNGFRLAWFDEQMSGVANAKRALEFTSLLSFTISPWERGYRIKKCQDVIDVIEDRKNQAAERNKTITEIVSAAKEMVKVFKKSIGSNPLSAGLIFKTTMEFLDRASIGAKAEFEGLETDDLIAMAQSVISLAPISK